VPHFIEVSHPIEAGMKTYPGLPEPRVEVHMSFEQSRSRYTGGTEFFIANLHLCGNTGTYVDSPFHRYDFGTDLANLPLDKLAHLPVEVIDHSISWARGINKESLRSRKLEGKAVLFRTGWSQHWGTDRYFELNPFLTADCCDALVEAEAAFVGIDSVNIDDVGDLARPAHSILLGAEIPVCEHMTNLQALPGQGGRLHAVPIAWKGGATFPVRAYVMF
jgi:kynurenine formamidase